MMEVPAYGRPTNAERAARDAQLAAVLGPDRDGDADDFERYAPPRACVAAPRGVRNAVVAVAGDDFVELPLTYGDSEGAVAPQAVTLVRHASATRFDDRSASIGTLVERFERAVAVASSILDGSTGLESLDDDDAQLVIEASLVNLYFFLRYVGAYSCAYSKLKPTLHGEMCNFAQRALLPGMRMQVTVPRSTFKSTIATHGLGAWLLWRNPNLRIGIFSGIQERAVDFMHQIQRMFDANAFVTRLRPETKPRSKRDGTWNEKIAIMPNRTVAYVEPSVRAHAAGGSTAGIHVDVALIDDIVSDKELTSSRDVTSEMIKRRDWLQTAIATILDSPAESSVVLSDTRYALDDPYEAPTVDSREHVGDWNAIAEWYDVAEDGAWVTYYRSALVGDESIFPEKYDKRFLERLAKSDFWTYITQYVNNPHSVEKVEFSAYDVGNAHLGSRGGAQVVEIDGVEYALAEADVVLAWDPASSGTRRNVRTSRSAGVALARFAKRRFVILEVRAGYWRPSELFDEMFAMHARWRDVARETGIEAAGNFKFLVDLVRDEERKRKTYIGAVGVPPLGDKLTTIRSALEPLLRAGTLFVVDGAREAWMEEFRVFPSMSLDVLDATKIAISRSLPPEADDVLDGDEDDEAAYEYAFDGRRRAYV